MTDSSSARLSMTPVDGSQNSSSQRTSSTLSIGPDDALRGQEATGRDTRPDSSQAAYQYTSDHESPTSSGTRLPTLSHENSHDGDAQDSTEVSVIGAPPDFMGTSSERFQGTPARGYCRIKKQPSHPRNSHSEELLEALWDSPDRLSGAGVEPPSKTDIVKTWKWEVINCFLAVGLTGSMFVILLHYDGQPIPDWGQAINLSTLIALMATFLRTMLVYVASEIIGQAKWNYLARGGRPKQNAPVRRLVETSRFNDASQGLLGAVKLLPTIIRDLSSLTAVIVMIVSLGTGSFVQQTIQAQSCQFPVDGARAFLPVARNLSSNMNAGGERYPFDDSRSVAIVQSAFAPDSEGSGSSISVGCSTGNCTFNNLISGIYDTLGVCSMCADASQLIGREDMVSAESYQWRNYTLPNGMTVQPIFQNTTSVGKTLTFEQVTELLVSFESTLGLDWAGGLLSAEMKGLSQWAFANITVLAPSSPLTMHSGLTDYVAATCTLYPCLRSYKASVKSGKLDEVLIGTFPAALNVASESTSGKTTQDIQKAMQGDDWDLHEPNSAFAGTAFHAIESPCLVDDTIWTPENKSFTVDMRQLLLLHANPDGSGSGSGRFTVQNTTAPAQCIYGMDNLVHGHYKSISRELFNGSCSVNSVLEGVYNNTRIDCDEKFWLASLLKENGTTPATIIKQIEAFTDRLSNRMRMGFFNDPEAVSGQVLQMTVCSRIQYSWLAFPAALVAVTAGLLAWTMIQSSRRRGRVMVWKTSILPFLFYSEQFVVQNAEDVSTDSVESFRRDEVAREPLLDLDQMEAEARQRRVRFDAFT